MNRKLTFPGGEPTINFDDLDRNNIANLAALTGALRAYGDNYIIQGVTGTSSITAGYIMLGGEIIQVAAHTKTSTHFVKVVTYDANGDKTFNDATSRQTWQINRATITAGSGTLAYADAPRLSNFVSVDIGAITNISTTTNINNLTSPGIVQRINAASGGLTMSKVVLTTPASPGQRLVLLCEDSGNSFTLAFTATGTVNIIRNNAGTGASSVVVASGATIELIRDIAGEWRFLSLSTP